MRLLAFLFLLYFPGVAISQEGNTTEDAVAEVVSEIIEAMGSGGNESEAELPPLATKQGCRMELARWIEFSQHSYIYAEIANDAADSISPERQESFARVISAFEEYGYSGNQIADALFDFCATYP